MKKNSTGISIPPEMNSVIKEFVADTYCKKVNALLGNFENDSNSVQVQKLMEKVDSYSSGKKRDGETILSKSAHFFCPLMLEGWSVGWDIESVKQKLNRDGIEGVYVEEYFADANIHGQWEYKTWSLRVFAGSGEMKLDSIPRFTLFIRNKLGKVIETLRDTVEHELIHMVQDIGVKMTAGTSDMWGMPKRKVRDPLQTPGGMSVIDFDMGKEDIREVEKEHGIKDIEFYTNLNDAWNEFKRILNVNIEKDKIDVANAFIGASRGQEIGENRWFGILKMKDEPRWRLAAKIFMKKVMNEIK